jgi:predicted ATPase
MSKIGAHSIRGRNSKLIYNFELDRRTTTLIATLSRRLDGIPRAIELAAACTATLGVEELTVGLDDRFHFLTGGRRKALPRQEKESEIC